MQGMAHTKVGGVLSGMNGNGNIYVPNNSQHPGIPDNFIFEEVDPSLDDDDSTTTTTTTKTTTKTIKQTKQRQTLIKTEILHVF